MDSVGKSRSKEEGPGGRAQRGQKSKGQTWKHAVFPIDREVSLGQHRERGSRSGASPGGARGGRCPHGAFRSGRWLLFDLFWCPVHRHQSPQDYSFSNVALVLGDSLT